MNEKIQRVGVMFTHNEKQYGCGGFGNDELRMIQSLIDKHPGYEMIIKGLLSITIPKTNEHEGKNGICQIGDNIYTLSIDIYED